MRGPLSFRDMTGIRHASPPVCRLGGTRCYPRTVTASLPVPHEPSPGNPEGRLERPAEPAKKPRAKRAPRSNRGRIAAVPPPPTEPVEHVDPDPSVDPGPPSPLPPAYVLDDIVIPPKPPLPASVAPAAPEEIETSDAVPELPAAPAAPEGAETADAAPAHASPEDAADVDDEPAIDDVEILESAFAPTEPDIEEPLRHAPDAASIEAAASLIEEARSDQVVDDSTPALLLRGVTKSFGSTRAVEGIDLTVPSGTFYGLVGPNGAGKTTTLSMIAGLLRPDRGSVRVAGVDAASDPLAAKRLMGVLPDRLRTFDRLTGRQLLYYYGVLRGLPSAVVERRTADLARAFDLTEALGRLVSDYSAGMAKKVMLAGAMIHSPRVLVLDEPFEAVDPVSSAIILDILSAYVAHGGTVILSSHGMELVERVCTRVAVLVAGQVLAEGTVDEVRGELTLEQRFVELAGGLSDVEGLEWLHTFSD